MQDTQKQIILKHLRSGKTITTQEASKNFGIVDPRAVIRDLRNDGINIKDRRITEIKQSGKKAYPKEYYL